MPGRQPRLTDGPRKTDCSGERAMSRDNPFATGAHFAKALRHVPSFAQTLDRRNTFAWISRNRRLARDFERYATTVHSIRFALP